MPVISTKCPTLNESNRNLGLPSSPDLEVLVRVDDAISGQEKVTGILCPQYDSNKSICKRDNKPCFYTLGFKGE